MLNWYVHPQHGYMLRENTINGWQIVVTALCLDTKEFQEDSVSWEKHKSRLYVNGGCGAIVAEEMRIGDHNPAFVPIEESMVPAHIRSEFLALTE